MSLALNAVIGHRPPTNAVGGLARGRFLFLVPWRDRSIVGTSHDPFTGEADDLSAAHTRLNRFSVMRRRPFPERASLRKTCDWFTAASCRQNTGPACSRKVSCTTIGPTVSTAS